jgi:O-antigen ligase
MNLISIKYKANYYALLLLAFVIPLERRLIAPLIIIFLLTSILNGSIKKIEKKKVLLFSGIYILYLIGLLFSTDVDGGLSDVMTKLALLIFPISFFISTIDFTEKINSILISFIEGCFVSALIAVIASALNYYYSVDLSVFFYGNIALFVHSSYLALFLSLCIAILYYYTLQGDELFKLKTKLSLFLVVFFSLFIILLSSKTGLITMLLIHFFAIIYLVFKTKAYVKGAIISLLLIVGLGLSYNYSDLFKGRIDELIDVVESDKTNDSSTGARKTIWLTALDLMKEKPFFGYGTGDAKNTLVNEYQNKGFNFLYNKKLNAHNQFLQTVLAVGLIGLITLLLMLIIPLFYTLKNGHYIYAIFLVLIGINFLTEAMLERQVGVVFYSFFNSLFFVVYFGENRNK